MLTPARSVFTVKACQWFTMWPFAESVLPHIMSTGSAKGLKSDLHAIIPIIGLGELSGTREDLHDQEICRAQRVRRCSTATSSILHATSPHLTSPGNVTSWHAEKSAVDLHPKPPGRICEDFETPRKNLRTSRGALRLLLSSQLSGDFAASPS